MRGMGRDASGVDGLARPWWAARPGPASGGGDGPDPACGSRDSGRRRLVFFIKNYICPGSIAIGTKELTHLSRIGCPGWKTGTKASSEPGLHALSVVVDLLFSLWHGSLLDSMEFGKTEVYNAFRKVNFLRHLRSAPFYCCPAC